MSAARASLAALLAGASALWAAFQWSELAVARAGEAPFCPLGDPGTCAAVWDAPLALAVERLTGLPVAAWGLAWSLAALALALLTLARRGPPWDSALRGAALGGVLAVGVLLWASLAGAGVCATCAGTYVLVLGVAVASGIVPRGPWLRSLAGGGALAAAATFVAAVPLWLGASAASDQVESAPLPGLVKPADRLARMIDGMTPRMQQALADALALYAADDGSDAREPRALLGPRDAPVRITEFSDVRCRHCADLHVRLEELRSALPPGSFALESRNFPLDGACNPVLEERAEDRTSCLAARARICLEERPAEAFALTGDLFAAQERLTPERIRALAARRAPGEELGACLDAAGTREKLLDDVRWAAEKDIHGTPLVLVNGRLGSALPHFLYALILTGGDPVHPAFEALPPPQTLEP